VFDVYDDGEVLVLMRACTKFSFSRSVQIMFKQWWLWYRAG